MKNKTINNAIIQVLKEVGHSLTAKQIYSRIIELDLYQFKSATPYHIVLTQLRRHCVGLDFPTANRQKHFKFLSDGTYDIKGKEDIEELQNSIESAAVARLKNDYSEYVSEFKKRILEQLKSVSPTQFENFSMNLLNAYGFTDVRITKPSRDGGIDGFGKLKVGVSELNVAFQCKRWNNNKVSRTEIDRFRGATQADFELAVFFTTSSFSKEALQVAVKKGAIPVTLIDGNLIVDLMIEKKFGIAVEMVMPIFLNEVDILFEEN